MRRKPKGTKDSGKDLLSVPGMERLDELAREVLKVPKDEIDRREREQRKPKHPTQERA